MSELETKKYPNNPILPIINLRSNKQAVMMTEMALNNGVGGVFLTDRREGLFEEPEVLAEAAAEVVSEFSPEELWLGVNCLGRCAVRSLEIFGDEVGVDGVWTNNAYQWEAKRRVEKDSVYLAKEGEAILKAAEGSAVHFAGTSMKGLGYVPEAQEAARLVAHSQRYADIVTTSGASMAVPMSQERLKLIRDVTCSEGVKLAVSSYVDPLNLARHLEHADYVLVGPSIETHVNSGVFDKGKLQTLMSAMIEYELSKLVAAK